MERQRKTRTSTFSEGADFAQRMAEFEIGRIERLHASAITSIRIAVGSFVVLLGIFGWIGYEHVRSAIKAEVDRQVGVEINKDLQPQLIHNEIDAILRAKTNSQLNEAVSQAITQQVGTTVEKAVRKQLQDSLAVSIQGELARQLPLAINRAVSVRLSSPAQKAVAENVITALARNGVMLQQSPVYDSYTECNSLDSAHKKLEADLRLLKFGRFIFVNSSASSKARGLQQTFVCLGGAIAADVTGPQGDIPTDVTIWANPYRKAKSAGDLKRVLDSYGYLVRISPESWPGKYAYARETALLQNEDPLLITIGQGKT